MESILIAKIEVPGLYSSDGIVKAMRTHFKDVYEFNYQNVMFNEGAEGMRRRLMGMCMMYSPDVVFLHIQTPEPLDLDLVQFLSEKSFVVLYTFDVKENMDWYKEYAPYVGLLLFCDFETVNEYRLAGFSNVDYLQSSADFDLYKPRAKPFDFENGSGEIVFIGNNFVGSNLNYPLSQERVDMVNYMQDAFGSRFKVYGLGWKGSKMVNVSEEIEAYHRCKIAITHNNYFREGYTSDRLWRAIGSGACTISQYYKGYYDDFPAVISQTWLNFNTLKIRCEQLLEADEFRNQIALRQNAWVNQMHSWSVRILQLKTLIFKHGNKRMENITGRTAD